MRCAWQVAEEAVLEQRRVLLDMQLRAHQDALLLVTPEREHTRVFNLDRSMITDV